MRVCKIPKFILYEGKKKAIVFEIACAVLLLIIFIWVSELIYDFSWDGNAYHKLAIGLLENGWNPFSELPENSKCIKAIFGEPIPPNLIWVEAYCKQPWIFAASVYSITDNIECGKAFTLISMFCAVSFTMYYGLSKGKVPKLFIVIAAIVLGINPIAMAQMDTFYVDGYLQTLFYMLILFLTATIDESCPISAKTLWSLIFCVLVLLSGTKFTGLLFGAVYCFFYCLYECWVKSVKRKKLAFDILVRRGRFYFITFVISIVYAGFPTYITNLIHHHNLIYPITLGKTDDFIAVNYPFPVTNSRVKNLFLSLFSKMENYTAVAGGDIELKIPFTFSTKEFVFLNSPAPRVSGFGLLFSGLLVTAIIIIVFYLWNAKKDICKRVFIIMHLGVAILLSAVIKESWWARFSPYIYIIVVFAGMLLSNTFSAINRRVVRGLIVLFLLIMGINLAAFLKPLPQDIHTTRQLSKELSLLSQETFIELDYDSFPGEVFNFMDYNINYIINPKLSEKSDAKPLYYKLYYDY